MQPLSLSFTAKLGKGDALVERLVIVSQFKR